MSSMVVVRTSGRQFFVGEGSEIEVNQIEGNVGDTVVLDDILLVTAEGNTTVGTPKVDGASLTASIIQQKRGPKLTIFKKIRRRGKQLNKGHRQNLTRLRVTSISAQ
jgi:large subunit ribosomal protein L21